MEMPRYAEQSAVEAVEHRLVGASGMTAVSYFVGHSESESIAGGNYEGMPFGWHAGRTVLPLRTRQRHHQSHEPIPF